MFSKTPPMVTPACTEFVNHWDKLAGTELLPRSRDFLDHPPHHLMPSVCIAERTEQGLLLRFIGSVICREWGNDFTGSYCDNRVNSQDRERFVSDLKHVCKFPVGLHCQAQIGTTNGRRLNYEAVYLPLAVDAGKPPRCVRFSKILGEMGHDEIETVFDWSDEPTWIDIGGGVPYPGQRCWEL